MSSEALSAPRQRQRGGRHVDPRVWSCVRFSSPARIKYLLRHCNSTTTGALDLLGGTTQKMPKGAHCGDEAEGVREHTAGWQDRLARQLQAGRPAVHRAEHISLQNMIDAVVAQLNDRYS